MVLKALSSAAADTESLHSLQVQASVDGIKRDCAGTQECRIECPLDRQHQRDGQILTSRGETCVRDHEAFLLSRESKSTLLHYPRRAYNAYIFNRNLHDQSNPSFSLSISLLVATLFPPVDSPLLETATRLSAHRIELEATSV